jgi:hypothetical protein
VTYVLVNTSWLVITVKNIIKEIEYVCTCVHFEDLKRLEWLGANVLNFPNILKLHVRIVLKLHIGI